jgi:hypothetical protein
VFDLLFDIGQVLMKNFNWHPFTPPDHLIRSFNPQTNGQPEVTNKIITVYLRCLVGDRLRSWLQWLPWVEFCFYTSYQTAMHTMPFEVVYDQASSPLLPFQAGSTRVAALEQQLRDHDIFMADIKEQLLQALSLNYFILMANQS